MKQLMAKFGFLIFLVLATLPLVESNNVLTKSRHYRENKEQSSKPRIYVKAILRDVLVIVLKDLRLSQIVKRV